MRSAIARVGGQVEVASRPGEGTRITLRVPFTVMMSRVMTIEAGGQIFGLPIEVVVETVRMPREGILQVGAAEAFVVRERTVPMINLSEAIGFPVQTRGRQANMVITTVAGQLAALEVDRFGEQLDVMLKPVEGLLTGLPGIAGTTLLGDGRVLIVLDVQELFQ